MVAFSTKLKAFKIKEDIRIYADEVYENILFDGSVHQLVSQALSVQPPTEDDLQRLRDLLDQDADRGEEA